MMGQQKRPPEVGASSEYARNVKPFTSSRCREASKWLEANSEILEDDTEQLKLDQINSNSPPQSSKEPTLQDELMFLQTRKVRALNVSQVPKRSKSLIEKPDLALPGARIPSCLGEALHKATIHTKRHYDCNSDILKDMTSTEMVESDPDSGASSSDLSVKPTSNSPNSLHAFGVLSEVGAGEKSISTKEVEHRHNGHVVIESTEGQDTARSSFLKLIWKAIQARNMDKFRPLPVMVDGKEVDLFLLSRKVRDGGGYSKITEASSWRKVSEELAFGPDCGPCLKLVYIKYLRLLETGTILGPTVSADPPFNQEIEAEQSLGHSSKEMLSAAAELNSAGSSKFDPLVSAVRWIKRVASNPGDQKRGQGLTLFQTSELPAEWCAALVSAMRGCLCKGDNFYPLDLLEHA